MMTWTGTKRRWASGQALGVESDKGRFLKRKIALPRHIGAATALPQK
ncbi:MAG TPA: hypothetical protein VGJ92_08970 [Methanocella sp.]|jgi:hypothetical protein